MRFLIAFICFSNLFLGCTANSSYYEDVSDPELFLEAVQNLSDIIVYDIFSPPVASRVYVYPTIAAYQIIAQSDTLNYKSLSGNLNDLKSSPPIPRNVNPYISAIYAYNIVGKALIFSEDKMEEFQDKFDSKIKKMGVPRSTRKASLKYASLVANHILDWANNDLYNQTRTYPKYTILEEDNFWKPTPPDYMDGIEPHWNKIRTMVLDSADQFLFKYSCKKYLRSEKHLRKNRSKLLNFGIVTHMLRITEDTSCLPPKKSLQVVIGLELLRLHQEKLTVILKKQ